MFYKMIEAKRNEWLASETCTVKAVIDYIVKTGQMRDAQVEAIKTYLFLKIACGCKPFPSFPSPWRGRRCWAISTAFCATRARTSCP